MEKLKYFSFLLLILCVGCSSCDDDPEPEPEPDNTGIVGTWKGEKVNTVYRNGVSIDGDKSDIRLILKDNGSFVFYEYDDEYGEWDEEKKGTWTQMEEYLYLYDDDDSDAYVISEITDTKLVLEEAENYSYNDNGTIYRYEQKWIMYRQ